MSPATPPADRPGPTPAPDVATFRAAWLAGATRPEDLVDGTLARIAATAQDHAWTSTVDRDVLLARAHDVVGHAGPLAGVPIGVKDSIDVAGLPTTVGCPAYAYSPGTSATCPHCR